MKNSKWLLLAGLAIMLMTFGCQKQMGFVAPDEDDANVASTVLGHRYNAAGNWFLWFSFAPTTSPTTFLMSIGQDNGQNGSVTVWRDAILGNFYVAFHVKAPYKLYETHVDVELDSAHLRHNKQGNLVPGQFPFQGPVVPPDQDYLMTIPFADAPWLSGWNGTDPLAWAALCKVFYVNENGDTVWNTGCGSDSTDHGKQLRLPSDCIDLHVVGGSTSGYQDIYYTGIPLVGGPFNVENNVHYDAWCADVHLGINPGTYVVCLWSPLDSLPDPLLYPFVPQTGWGNVAWLINNRTEWGSLSMWQVQTVIWALLGEPPVYPMSPDAVVLYNKALGHDSYRPTGSPAMFPVLNLACGTQSFQVLFTEVDP